MHLLRSPLARRALTVLTLVAVLIGLAGPGASASGLSQAVSPSAHTLVEAWTADYKSLDPAGATTDEDQEIGVNLYQRLLQFKFTPQKNGSLTGFGLGVVPQLATSWQMKGPVITFHLRSGVKFYPSGNPVTAYDVQYSFDRLVSVPGNGMFQAGVAGLYRKNQFKVINPMTIQITFENPQGKPTAVPVALASMRFQQFGIIDEKVAKEHATKSDPWSTKWLTNHVAGSGPYYVASHQPGQQVVLKAVPHDWEGTPYYTTVVLRIVGGADVVALMESGEINYLASGSTGGLTPREADELQKAGYPVVYGPTPDILRADLSIDVPPLNNVKLRQAIADAVPYNQIIQTVFSGRASRATSIVNPGSPDAVPAWNQYQTNISKAKQLLKESNTPSSFVLDIWYSTDSSFYQDVALIMQESLNAAGIKTKLEPRPSLQLEDLEQARINHQPDQGMSGMLLNDGVIWLDDPDTNIDLWGKCTGTANWAHFCNPEVDKLHTDFRDSLNVKARYNAYKTVQDLMANDVGALPVAVLGRTIVTSKGITGVTVGSDPYARYFYLKGPKS